MLLDTVGSVANNWIISTFKLNTKLPIQPFQDEVYCNFLLENFTKR